MLHMLRLVLRRDQGEAWGNEPLWAVQKPHRSRLELEQEAWLRAVRAHLPSTCYTWQAASTSISYLRCHCGSVHQPRCS